MRRLAMTLALLAALAVTAPAGEIEDLARQAEAQANAGRHLEAVETLRRAMDALTAKAPLGLRRVQFVAEPPQGFGLYKPRPDNVFRRGEPLIVYAEPVGLGWKQADGLNLAVVVTDFEIRTPDGKVLGGQRDFGRFNFSSHDRNQEIMTHLTITLSGAPAGTYVFAATYRDQMTGKSATLDLPFEIR
jgi:hypothetical protein